MTPADFEESEYRGPLYNQLERGNHLVWEPGQVFEKHIGIDRAAYVTDPYFWGLHSLTSPISGVVLVEYDWDYIWRARLRNKVLPDFQLNLFVQVKRPHAGTRPRGKIKTHGITGDYWKFEVTPHQQLALERMSSNLSGRALVCYASPAFHTQASLYEHTKNQSIVQNSSFPPVNALADHSAWYYDKGGLFGVANPDFERVEIESLQNRIYRFVQQSYASDEDATSALESLAKLIILSTQEIREPAATETWFHLLLSRVEDMISNASELGHLDERRIEALRAFAQIRAFCNAYRLDWYVLGKGGGIR